MKKVFSRVSRLLTYIVIERSAKFAGHMLRLSQNLHTGIRDIQKYIMIGRKISPRPKTVKNSDFFGVN